MHENLTNLQSTTCHLSRTTLHELHSALQKSLLISDKQADNIAQDIMQKDGCGSPLQRLKVSYFDTHRRNGHDFPMQQLPLCLVPQAIYIKPNVGLSCLEKNRDLECFPIEYAVDEDHFREDDKVHHAMNRMFCVVSDRSKATEYARSNG